MSTFDKISKLIAENLNIDIAKIKPESEFIKDLGADSLDLVETLMTLETEFDIEVTEEDATSIKTVADAIRVIESK